MIFQPEIVEPVAPFTGALLYPLEEILDLARGIVHNLEKHHKILLSSAQDRSDDEEEAIQLNNLVDINLTIYAIDPVRWKEAHEVNNPDYEWTTAELEGLTHPRKGEEGLLGLCRIPRAEFVSIHTISSVSSPADLLLQVIQAAIERRKSKRGIAPSDDPYWRKEDALMNLLQFFSNWSSGGLFVPS